MFYSYIPNYNVRFLRGYMKFQHTTEYLAAIQYILWNQLDCFMESSGYLLPTNPTWFTGIDDP